MYTSLLAFASVSLVASNPLALYKRQTNDGYLDCEQLVVIDGSENSVTCRLKSAPAAPLTVFLQSNGIKLEKCSFDFTPENWDTFQSIPIHPIPVFDNIVTTHEVEIIGQAYTDVAEFASPVSIRGERIRKAGASCASVGDPHFRVILFV